MAAVLSIKDTSVCNQRRSREEIKLIYASFLGKSLSLAFAMELAVAVTTHFHRNNGIVAGSLVKFLQCEQFNSNQIYNKETQVVVAKKKLDNEEEEAQENMVMWLDENVLFLTSTLFNTQNQRAAYCWDECWSN